LKTTGLKGRDYLAESDFSREEIETILEVAGDLKRQRAQGQIHDHLLRAKTLFMIFYNRSLRTRNSFEAAMTQLGGHAHYLDPERIYSPAMAGKEEAFATERVSDVARVLARMGEGIAIRCFGDRVNWDYGAAHAMLQEFARWSEVPVFNMEDDVFHPFQGLADMLTIQEKFGAFRGVRLAMSWAYSPSVAKPRAVPQSAILYATLLGMDVTLSYPEGMELDTEIIARARANAETYGGKFEIVHDFQAGIEGAHAVYPKAWAPTVLFQPPVGQADHKAAQAIFDGHKDWKCTEGTMALADKRAIYLHCLPADRGFEAADEVMDRTSGPGWNSAIFDQAENRLHVQKAVLNLVL
jgi:N-acetylornithine carbamoyltransferase